MPSHRFVRRAAVAGAAVVAVAGGGTALAADSSGTGSVYQGCLSAANGSLYSVAVDPTTTPTCRPHDTAVTWNQTGPAGAQGTQGPKGDKGDKGDTGATGPMPQLSTYVVKGDPVQSAGSTVPGSNLSCTWPDAAVSGGYLYQSTAEGSGLWSYPWEAGGHVGGFTFGGWIIGNGWVTYQAYIICQKAS